MTKNCICDLSEIHERPGEGKEKMISKGDWVDLYITLKNQEYSIDAICEGKASIQINYCPICGRDLQEKE